MATAKLQVTGAIDIDPIRRERLYVNVVGRTPLILNRLSEKVMHELLMPRGRKNSAEKATSLKHDPLAEFRSSPNRIAEDDAPTLLALPATAFKGALRTSALDVPGITKSALGRNSFIEGELIGIYGVPQILLSAVRSSDVARTPDIRSRCIVPHWCASFTVDFSLGVITEKSIVNLLANAGMTVGVGDWRPEKGSGTFGQFDVGVASDDEAFLHIQSTGGRAVQVAAMDAPEPYNDETQELLSWFGAEVNRRGFKVAA